MPHLLADADDAVFVGLVRIAFLHGDDVAAGLVVELDHRMHAALFRLHDHVGQQQRERLVADEIAGAPHGVAEAERRLLAGEAGLPGLRLESRAACSSCSVLPRWASVSFELELHVEMVFDDAPCCGR